MKKLMYIFGIAALLLAAGCKKDDSPGLPFSEYSLTGTSSSWIWVIPSMDEYYDGGGRPVLHLINSDEELQQYIAGTDFPPIDFSKQTLLCAYGYSSSLVGIPKINRIEKLSENKYLLTIELTTGNRSDIRPWSTAILIDKQLGDESEVELNVRRKTITR